MKKILEHKYYWLASGWALCILFATLASTGTLIELHLKDLFAYDKPIHMTLFGVQAWFIIKAIYKNKNLMKVVAIACLISTGYGVLTEILQGMIVLLGRSFDYFDMIADAIGCIVVYVWFWVKKDKTKT